MTPPPRTRSLNASRPPDSVNRYTKIDTTGAGTAATHTYDANGNLKSDENFKYNWHYANRLGEIRRKQDDSLIVTFKVNPFGQRIEQDAISPPPGALDFVQYYHDGARVVEERDSADAVAATYVWGNGIDELLQMKRGTAERYFHENSIGSIYLVTDAAGTNLEKYDYELYGKPTIFAWDGVQWVPQTDPISPIKNPYLFQGREFDFAKTAQGEKSELYYFRARYLQPRNMGRFLSRDPELADPLLNQYTFVRNNPPVRVDPQGLRDSIVKGVWDSTTPPPSAPTPPGPEDVTTPTPVGPPPPPVEPKGEGETAPTHPTGPVGPTGPQPVGGRGWCDLYTDSARGVNDWIESAMGDAMKSGGSLEDVCKALAGLLNSWQSGLEKITHRKLKRSDKICLAGRCVGVDKLVHFLLGALARCRLSPGQTVGFLTGVEVFQGTTGTGVASGNDLLAGVDGAAFMKQILEFGVFHFTKQFDIARHVNDHWTKD